MQRKLTLIAPESDSISVAHGEPLKDSSAAAFQHTKNSDTAFTASDSVPDVCNAFLGPRDGDESFTVLRAEYKATTNRMLRVAVNGFFESLGVIVQVMEELDTDVLQENGIEGLEGVQGVEQGLAGETISGA